MTPTLLYTITSLMIVAIIFALCVHAAKRRRQQQMAFDLRRSPCVYCQRDLQPRTPVHAIRLRGGA